MDRRRTGERRHEDRRTAGALVADLQVGESLTLEALHGTGVLRFTLDAKDVGLLQPGESFDSVRVVLTLSRKSGQNARVVVEAPPHVKVAPPNRKIAA